MIDDNVASLTGSLRSNNPLGTNNLASEGSLVLVNIHRNITLIPIRLCLQKVLLLSSSTSELGQDGSSSNEGGTSSQ